MFYCSPIPSSIPMDYCHLVVKIKVDIPKIGVSKDVLGTLSASIIRNTVKARRTEIPEEIFSPASGGTQNTIRIRTERSAHGRIMFIR